MFKLKKATIPAFIGLVCFLAFCSPLRAQEPSNEQLFKITPGNSLFCIRINDLDRTLNQIDQFFSVGTSPLGISMFARMQIMRMLGSPQPVGVNMNGSFAIFGTVLSTRTAQNNPASNMFIGILSPVTDYKQFINGNPNCTQPDSEGVSEITQNGRTASLVTQVGGYALLAPPNDYDKLISARAEITNGNTTGFAGVLNDVDLKQATTDPFWLYVNMQEVSRTFGPQVSTAMEQMKEMTKDVSAENSGAMPGNPRNIINMYTGIIDALLEQTQFVSIVVNPEPNVLRVTGTMSSIPQTDMAKMFVGDTSAKPKNQLLPYLENGAVMNYQVNINSLLLKQLQLAGIDMFETMAGNRVNTEALEKMKTLTGEVMDCVVGPMAYSVAIQPDSRPAFIIKYALAVKDESKFRTLIKEALETFNTSGVSDFYKSMGIEMRFETNEQPGSYRGVSIDSAMLVFKSTEADSPQAQMLSSMYGDGFDYQWAIVNRLFVCAVGGNANSAIRELIDRAQSSSSEVGSEINKALSLLPGAQQSDFFITFNLPRIFRMMTAMMPILPIPQTDFETSSNIAAIGKAANGQLVVNIALPKEHIQEIMAAVLAMQQQTMMQQQGQPTPQQPMPTPQPAPFLPSR